MHRRASILFGRLHLPVQLPKLYLSRPPLALEGKPGSGKLSRLARASRAAHNHAAPAGCAALVTAATPQPQASATPASVLSKVKSILPRLLSPFSRRSASTAPVQGLGANLPQLQPVPFSLETASQPEPYACSGPTADLQGVAGNRLEADVRTIGTDPLTASASCHSSAEPAAQMGLATAVPSLAELAPDAAAGRQACCSGPPVQPSGAAAAARHACPAVASATAGPQAALYIVHDASLPAAHQVGALVCA